MGLEIEYSKYELNAAQKLGFLAEVDNRAGALFRFTWPDGKTGYADCMPWPELGDAPIDEQIEMLKKGRLSILMEQTMWLARRDADWRAQEVSAYKLFPRVKNHFLISDYSRTSDQEIYQAKAQGFTTFKIKLSENVEEEAKWVDRFIRTFTVPVRLDFNCKLSFPLVERFFEILSQGSRARVEFLEDPLPWNLQAWQDASKIFPLAADGVLSQIDLKAIDYELPFKFIILKPARMDVARVTSLVDRFGVKMVVTHSMDHPVGEMHALLVAYELKKKYPNRILDCGCYPTRAYEANTFTSEIPKKGPYIDEVAGTGIGFNNILKELKWNRLR